MLTACAGKAPPASNNPDAANAADASPTDGGGSATSATVSGKTIDYNAYYLASTSDTLPASSISTDGIAPPETIASGTDATYSLDVPVGSKLFFLTSRANFLTTRNIPISVAAMPVMQDQMVVSEDYVNNQYTLVQQTRVGGDGYLAALLEKPDGTPLEGVTLANVVLQTTATPPVTVPVTGPYFVGATNELDKNLTVSTAEPVGALNATAQVALLNVPPGTYTLSVTYLNGMGASVTNTSTVVIAADAATLALSQGQMAMTTVTTPSFATDIYPKLQSAGNGGLGCGNCHTAGGPAAILKYDDPPATVLANMTAANVLDLTTPAASLVLVNPLYPPSNGHPNASFLDVNDPSYQLFLLWITQGAKP
ncbi:MAG TPA: hypothetical protein VGF94_16280 [Kofleriaceae bacterium]